jgi:hypothetical protein
MFSSVASSSKKYLTVPPVNFTNIVDVQTSEVSNDTSYTYRRVMKFGVDI